MSMKICLLQKLHRKKYSKSWAKGAQVESYVQEIDPSKKLTRRQWDWILIMFYLLLKNKHCFSIKETVARLKQKQISNQLKYPIMAFNTSVKQKQKVFFLLQEITLCIIAMKTCSILKLISVYSRSPKTERLVWQTKPNFGLFG